MSMLVVVALAGGIVFGCATAGGTAGPIQTTELSIVDEDGTVVGRWSPGTLRLDDGESRYAQLSANGHTASLQLQFEERSTTAEASSVQAQVLTKSKGTMVTTAAVDGRANTSWIEEKGSNVSVTVQGGARIEMARLERPSGGTLLSLFATESNVGVDFHGTFEERRGGMKLTTSKSTDPTLGVSVAGKTTKLTLDDGRLQAADGNE